MATSAKKEYHYVGHYAGTLEDGRPVEPSEVVELDKDQVEANKVLIDEGFLVEVEKAKGGETK